MKRILMLLLALALPMWCAGTALPAELYPQIREIVMFNFCVPCTGVVYRFNRAPS